MEVVLRCVWMVVVVVATGREGLGWGVFEAHELWSSKQD